MDVPSKMIQQGKLAWLVRRFEHDRVEPERVYKPIRIGGIEVSILIEQADPLCAFSRFDDQLEGARVEPPLPLFNPPRKRPVTESAVMAAPDWKGLDRGRYQFTFVRREFLGEARTFVFDVRPLRSGGDGFSGRIWIEARDYTLIRFNGINQGTNQMLSSFFNDKRLSFHMPMIFL